MPQFIVSSISSNIPIYGCVFLVTAKTIPINYPQKENTNIASIYYGCTISWLEFNCIITKAG